MVLLRVQISYPSQIHSTTQDCKECYSEIPRHNTMQWSMASPSEVQR